MNAHPSPQVSVIIPTYQHRDFIRETLDSVFAQTFSDYEVIVVNDGSPDDTAEIFHPLAEAGRIRCIEQANQGQAAARNRGLAEAKGEFIAFLDDDDLWPPDKLEWMTALLRADSQAVLAYGPALTLGNQPHFIYPSAQAPTGQVHAQFLQRNWIMSPGQTLIRSAALHRSGGFDGGLWGVDDWDLYIRLSAAGRFVYRHQVSLHYRYHPGNASNDANRMAVNAQALQLKHFGRFPAPSQWISWIKCRLFIRECRSLTFIREARNAARSGDHKRAGRIWRQTLKADPAIACNQRLFREMMRALTPRGRHGTVP